MAANRPALPGGELHDRLLALLRGAEGARIALVGDFMLDQYLYGDAERISPEAPVPVLRIVGREARLGGAASVAAGIAALGRTVHCVGVVGEDASGTDLIGRLDALGVDTSLVCRVGGRPTTVKTRLIGMAQHRHRQQLVRMDEEDASAVEEETEQRLWAAGSRLAQSCEIVCIQDYGKGVVTEGVCRRVIEAARSSGARVLVDPMRAADTARYRGAWLATPNRSETEAALGGTARLGDVEAVRAAGAAILAAYGTEHVCVTLDVEGCALIGRGGRFEHVATKPREVYDVTGAGDAVLAALAVGLAAGAELREAAELANLAGGLEVEKFGCVPVTRAEMIGELLLERRARVGKCCTRAELAAELARRRALGQRIVFTNGCFDVLHRGHVEYLNFCRRQGDVVVVGLNSDASVRRQQKGADRPINGEADRAAVLAGLASVDYVVVFDEDTPAELVAAVEPDVLVKGADWKGRPVAGRESVEARGGKVVFAPLVEGCGTTQLVERIRRGGG